MSDKTLRDEFAMAAIPLVVLKFNKEGCSKELAAKVAYEYADAMVAACNKPTVPRQSRYVPTYPEDSDRPF